MMADDSHNLLLRFSRDRSDEAIRALVQRHSPLVFATALRRLNGNHAAAQDVTQEVFTLLAKKAASLQDVFLSGWLHRQACRRAANHVRTEQRRRRREKVAGEAMETSAGTDHSPFLSREVDEALLKLSPPDRDAVILRFFEGMDYRQVGGEMGITEEAARKRVKRSLERLGETLKKQGLPLTGGSLEANLLGLECPPMPEALARRIAGNAIQGPAGGSTTLAFFKPIFVGSMLASLAAGGTLAMRSPEQEPGKSSPPSTTARSRTGRPPSLAASLPAGSPLEAIISEIRRLKSGPDHTLTRLQLAVLLENIGIGQIPEFIALAEERLSPAEQAAAYEPLLKRWTAKDPNAALTYVLDSGVAARRDGAIWGNTLLGNLFTSWLERSREAPAAWFIAHQDHPFLRPGGKGADLVGHVSKGYHLHGNHVAVFRLVDALHSPEAKINAFNGITGEGSMWMMSGKGKAERWINFHRALQTHGAPDLKKELTLRFWRNLSQRQYADVVEAMKTMEPIDKFHASLGMLAATFVPKHVYNEARQITSTSNAAVDDREARETAAMQAAKDAGVPSGQALQMAGGALSSALDDAAFKEWVSKHPKLDLDASILRRIRTELASQGGRIDDPKEAISLRWTVMIEDPELRLRAARGTFLRLLAAKPELAARSLAALPEDLSAELNSMMPATP